MILQDDSHDVSLVKNNITSFYSCELCILQRGREITVIIATEGAKGDWDFRMSDLVNNPDGTDI